MINLNLSEYNLLQDIPSSFTIDTVTDVASVSVLINDVVIYTTSLYEYNGVMSADYDEVPVLISDITSEISNRPDEKVRMKFSWRFDDNARWINTFKDWNVFNNVYIDTFK